MSPLNRSAAPRTALAGGVTAALLTVPFFAVPAVGLDVASETEKALDGGGSSVSDVLEPAAAEVVETAEKVADTADDTAEKAADTADAVAETVKEAAPEPAGDVDDAPAGESSGDGAADDTGADGTEVAAAGATTPVPPATESTTTEDEAAGAAAGAPAPQRGVGSPTSSTLNLLPAPPVVSAPFAFETPVVATELAPVPTIPSMGALEALFGSVADAAGGPLPTHVPGSLVATATGLIMLLGAAHILHATGRLDGVRS